jgi:hypothetical protein
MDFTDGEMENNYGWINFDRWDTVAFYRDMIYGVWVDEEEQEELTADFTSASIDGQEFFWYECDGTSDFEEESIEVSFGEEGDYSISR